MNLANVGRAYPALTVGLWTLEYFYERVETLVLKHLDARAVGYGKHRLLVDHGLHRAGIGREREAEVFIGSGDVYAGVDLANASGEAGHGANGDLARDCRAYGGR